MTFTESSRFDHSEQSLTRMFQPDPLTPYEHLRNSRRTVPLEPEKHLMHAILEEAIKTYRMHVSAKGGRDYRLFLDAQNWIMARNDEWLFSFENICEVLGLDPDFVRSGLNRWKDQQRDVATPVPKALRYRGAKRALRAVP